MDKPLSNLDYLIKRDGPQSQENARPSGSRGASDLSSSADSAIEEGLALYSTPVLQALQKRNDRCTVFELVDDLKIRVNDLRPVLDLMEQRFRWIEVQHVDLKGDDPVVLTDRGRAQLQRFLAR